MNEMEAMAILSNRVSQLDSTLFMGLKCITVLMDDIELMTRDDVSHEEREVARRRVRELIQTMKGMF